MHLSASKEILGQLSSKYFIGSGRENGGSVKLNYELF
jgi:hypothetical protein